MRIFVNEQFLRKTIFKPVNNHESTKITELIFNQNVMTCKKTTMTKSFWGKKTT